MPLVSEVYVGISKYKYFFKKLNVRKCSVKMDCVTVKGIFWSF